MRIKLLLVTLLLALQPGCIDNSEPVDTSDHVFRYVTFEIFHGENLSEASAFYNITLKLDYTAAPIHTQNMIDHVNQGNYNMTHFHRIIDDFMIQGGDFENHDGTGGYASSWYGYCSGQAKDDSSQCAETSWTIPDEADNGLVHSACAVSMAKTSYPNTGGSQFFLIPDDVDQHTWLDGVHTVFGEISEGCEHVTTLSEVATGSGDRPATPVIIYQASEVVVY